ncbi:MAG: hypothetical protein MI919_19765, partial [Holophagales bacterium]|nr:hypothetical protein [Holophagales bacterium]
VLMAEVGPRGLRTGQDSTEEVWAWYEKLFAHLDEQQGTVRGLAIINNHWDPEPMWSDGTWGDFRLQNDPEIARRWREKMAEPRFVHTTHGLGALIRFEP